MKLFSALPSEKKWLACFLLLFYLLVSSAGVRAQTDTTQVNNELTVGRRIIVETKDGLVVRGIFIGRSDAGIKVRTDNAGEVDIPNDQITWMEVVDERMKDENYIFENPNSTSYLFSSSAFSPQKGEAYYKNIYLVVNSFNYAITNNFSVAAGFEITSAISANPTFFINPKYNFQINEKVHAGAGALYASVPGAKFSGLGIGYGIVTYGNADDNITFGAGYGYIDKELANKPVFTLSGMKRLNRRFGLVSENWIVPREEYYGVYSYGVRYMAQRVSVDLAFLNNQEFASDIFFLGIPYIDFVINLRKK